MKKAIICASLLALLIPGAAFAGSSTDAALGLGAFAVFNQIISGTGVFGVFAPAPRPVYLPAPPPPVAPPVVVQPQYYPVYVPAPVYHAPVHYWPVYRAPARVVVIEKRVVVAPGHGFIPPGHARNGHPGRGWR
jgi:hypothetical protein